MAENKLKIKVPTYIVRNEDIFLNNNEFLLYTRLSFLYFRNYQEEKIVIDHKKLMLQLEIKDTRTLKKYLNGLYKNKLIKNKIDKLSRKGYTTILFNSHMYNKDKNFTLMNITIFDYINKIGENGYRLIWYYKSHINLKDKNRDRSYCYVGYETLEDNLRIGRGTISKVNQVLKKEKLIKIQKHKLEHDDEYNDNEELLYDKYNNHYYVSNALF